MVGEDSTATESATHWSICFGLRLSQVPFNAYMVSVQNRYRPSAMVEPAPQTQYPGSGDCAMARSPRFAKVAISMQHSPVRTDMYILEQSDPPQLGDS